MVVLSFLTRKTLRCQQWTCYIAGSQRWASIVSTASGRQVTGFQQALQGSAGPQVIGVGRDTWAKRAQVVEAAPPRGLYALERADYFKHPQILLEQDDEIAYRTGGLWLGDDKWRAVRRECMAVSQGCGLLDFSSLSRFVVEGAGTAEMLQYLCTNNVAGPEIPVNALKYTMLTDESGGVIGSMTILKMAEEKYMCMCYALSSRDDLALLESHLPGTASIRDVTWDHALLMLTGPEADSVLQPLMSEEDRERLAALPSFMASDVSIAGVQVSVSRVSYCGGLGYELHVPKEHGAAARVYEQLRESEAAAVTEIGYTAMQVMRTEVARPCFTVEIPCGSKYLDCVPKFLAKLKEHQPNFCGKEAINSSKADRFLVHLEAEDPQFFINCMNGAAPSRGGAHRLLLDGDDVGYITSGFYGFRAGKAVMFALADKRPELRFAGKKSASELESGRLLVTGPGGAIGSAVTVVSDAEALLRSK